MRAQDFQKIEAYMCACLHDRAHDRGHVHRVLYTALDLAGQEQGVELDVLIAACLLHDIARGEQAADPAVCHARAGAEKARAFLLQNGFSLVFAAGVAGCIRTHRFRSSDPPQSIEAKILFDADKLDAAGAIGIARTLLYKGMAGEPLYTLRPDGTISDGSGDSEPSFFQEYKFKLEKVYGRFLTASGQKAAEKRRVAAVSFYENLLAEVRAPQESGTKQLAEYLTQD